MDPEEVAEEITELMEEGEEQEMELSLFTDSELVDILQYLDGKTLAQVCLLNDRFRNLCLYHLPIQKRMEESVPPSYRVAQTKIREVQISKIPYLELGNLQLTRVPWEIGTLSFLETLDLRFNQLSTLPPEIGYLRNLRHLYLTDNQLTTLLPEIGNLSSLKDLFLDHNLLTTLPAEIGNLSSLQTLVVSHNQLTDLPPEIGNLSTLQNLYLSHNQLTWDSFPFEFQYLKNHLELLDVSRNPLSGEGIYDRMYFRNTKPSIASFFINLRL